MNPVAELIDLALSEDIGPGDVTTEAVIDPHATGRAEIVAKQPALIAGIEIAKQVFFRLDETVSCRSPIADGATVAVGDVVLTVRGKLATLLKGERVALNFLQRLSGIASRTRDYVSALSRPAVRLVDTRKTTPGWRVLEKYAVRVGGAANHRMGLFDGVLIKDNHIAACGGIQSAVARIRRRLSHLMKIEIEVTSMAQVQEALAAGADVIMLDNMDPGQIRAAVELIDGRAVTEVSGGVLLEDLPVLEKTGVDIISIGALTHTTAGIDLSMRILPAGPSAAPAPQDPPAGERP